MTYNPAHKRYPKPPDYVPDPTFPEGHRYHGQRRCKAWSPNQGRQCMHIAMRGLDVCRNHGGKSLRGLASPSAKHLRYSKYIPVRLSEAYEHSIADPELLSLRNEIALVDSRIIDLLRRVDTKESGLLWKRLREQYTVLREALLKKDAEAVGLALGEFDRLISQGLGDHAIWREIEHLLLLRRRLVETERKRLIEMQAMITAEEAMLLVRNLLNSIKENVTDRRALAKIQEDFIRFTARRDH